MQEFRKIAEWISQSYRVADKIVEVGVGEVPCVLAELRERLPDCKLVATDVQEVPVPEGVRFVLDDVTQPELSVYGGADLIFSLRAPPDLYPALTGLAEKVKSDLLIKPASSEESPRWGELINYSGVPFYLLRTR